MEIPNLFLDVDVESFASQAPGLRALRAQLEAWLVQLDPDDVAAKYQAEGVLPDLGWQSGNGWTLRFKAIPKSSGRGPAGSPAVGMWAPRGASVCRPPRRPFGATWREGRAVRGVGSPYVIAVLDDRISPPLDLGRRGRPLRSYRRLLKPCHGDDHPHAKTADRRLLAWPRRAAQQAGLGGRRCIVDITVGSHPPHSDRVDQPVGQSAVCCIPG